MRTRVEGGRPDPDAAMNGQPDSSAAMSRQPPESTAGPHLEPATTPESPSEPTYQVSELLEQIQATLRASLPSEVWVTGEITGWREPSHMTYFTLSEPNPDGQSTKATLSAVIFPNDRSRIDATLKRSTAGMLSLTDGVNVRIKGRLAIYPPQGRLQLQMTGIDPAFTMGQLALERSRILAVLQQEGLLERNQTRPLSLLPLRIALISSYDSAAYNDVIEQLAESGFAWQVTPFNVFVQGSRAERSIMLAFSHINPQDYDVVVLARGGGSATDLAAFDTEGIARAVANCPVPVLTGIGHEIDRSLADEAAGWAYKTPTACAQALIDMVVRFQDEHLYLWHAITQQAANRLLRQKTELLKLGQGVQQAPVKNISLARQFLRDAPRRVRLATANKLAANQALIADIPGRLSRATRSPLQSASQQLLTQQHRLKAASENSLVRHSGRLGSLEARLKALDPVNIMARGWSITRNREGEVVRSIEAVAAGDQLTTELADGDVTSTVTDTIQNPDPQET